MWLSKGGITLEITHPAEIARYKRLGYIERKKEAPPVIQPAEVESEPALTPEEENAAAVQAVNESKGTPKVPKGGSK